MDELLQRKQRQIDTLLNEAGQHASADAAANGGGGGGGGGSGGGDMGGGGGIAAREVLAALLQGGGAAAGPAAAARAPLDLQGAAQPSTGQPGGPREVYQLPAAAAAPAAPPEQGGSSAGGDAAGRRPTVLELMHRSASSSKEHSVRSPAVRTVPPKHSLRKRTRSWGLGSF